MPTFRDINQLNEVADSEVNPDWALQVSATQKVKLSQILKLVTPRKLTLISKGQRVVYDTTSEQVFTVEEVEPLTLLLALRAEDSYPRVTLVDEYSGKEAVNRTGLLFGLLSTSKREFGTTSLSLNQGDRYLSINVSSISSNLCFDLYIHATSRVYTGEWIATPYTHTFEIFLAGADHALNIPVIKAFLEKLRTKYNYGDVDTLDGPFNVLSNWINRVGKQQVLITDSESLKGSMEINLTLKAAAEGEEDTYSPSDPIPGIYLRVLITGYIYSNSDITMNGHIHITWDWIMDLNMIDVVVE